MDFSKLSSNEKLAIYGSVAVILAGLISNWGGLLFLSILAAVGVAVVVFLPQFSPTTSLPGSKGSLLAALGIIAAAGAVITALQWIGYLGLLGSLNTIMFYIAVIGSLVMAWAGWQELQSEGGKWVFGTTGSPSTSAAAPPPAAAAPPAAAVPPAAAAPQEAAPPPSTDTAPMADAPSDRDDEDRPTV